MQKKKILKQQYTARKEGKDHIKDLELVVYDVSLRVPGNPIVATTSPYTKYQYGQTFGVGRRIAME
ncbi:MAG: DUF1297 domain-containing protein, partial [Candidatus Bathyarchaeota archaeon]